MPEPTSAPLDKHTSDLVSGGHRRLRAPTCYRHGRGGVGEPGRVNQVRSLNQSRGQRAGKRKQDTCFYPVKAPSFFGRNKFYALPSFIDDSGVNLA